MCANSAIAIDKIAIFMYNNIMYNYNYAVR